MKDYEKMTVKELSDELTNLGVAFKKKSRKAELIELLKAEVDGKTEEKPAKTETKPKKKVAKVDKEAESTETKKSTKKAKKAEKASTYTGYAIVRTGGKQYQVSAGSLLRIEKITGNVGDTVEFNEVLALIDGDNATIGQPLVEGATVTAKIVEQDRAKKVLVFKKKRRKGYRVKRGHRQMYTAIRISDISA